LFTGTHAREDIATEAYEEELDMGHSGSCLNSSITSAWSEHSLDPEDIRVRPLYWPLIIYTRILGFHVLWELSSVAVPVISALSCALGDWSSNASSWPFPILFSTSLPVHFLLYYLIKAKTHKYNLNKMIFLLKG